MISNDNNELSSPSSSKLLSSISYRSRIGNLIQEKKSPIVLALDLYLENFNNNNKILFKKCKDIVSSTASQICGIKINFHLLLSLSNIQILELNILAHKLNLQIIADIKLNDIGNTNIVTVNRLQKLGFDAVIVNPVIGITEMKSLVSHAHSISFGIISLVYMSHPSSFEGYGLNIVIPSDSESWSSELTSSLSSSSLDTKNNYPLLTNTNANNNINNNFNSNKNVIPMYQLLYNYACLSGCDGIVIGATKFDIINEISKLKDKIPIYSPGLITQGGSIENAIKSGTDYFIIGRHIIDSNSPNEILTSIVNEIRRFKKF